MSSGIEQLAAGPAREPAESINFRLILLIASAGAFGGLMFGFDIAIITGAAPFLEAEFGLSHLELGFAFSSLLFGCVIGAALGGMLANRLGRRTIMLGVAVVFAATSIATGIAADFTAFNAARFLGGIAVGAVSLVAPMYISEIAPASLRGRLGALYQMAIVAGILISYLINYLLRNEGPDAWRLMFYTGVVPSLIFFFLIYWAPETPRYLVMRGRADEALRILDRIGRGRGGNQALAEIQGTIRDEPLAFAAFRARNVRAPLFVGFWLAILIHFSGVNTIIDYAPIIFRSAGFTVDAALFSTFVVGIANFVFTLVSFWVIDRLGRRPLYIFGSVGMGATLVALVASVLTGNFQGMIAVSLIVLYLMFFASCIGPVFWTLLPEIFPNHVRSTALIVPVLVQWVANAVVVLFFPVVFARAGEAVTFGLLAFACFTQAVFAWRFLPETKNRTLEQIAQAWDTKAGTVR